jgi:hypothetical protein
MLFATAVNTENKGWYSASQEISNILEDDKLLKYCI